MSTEKPLYEVYSVNNVFSNLKLFKNSLKVIKRMY